MISVFEAEYWTIANDAWLWIIVAGFIIAFVLAFGIGANDVANSFGSSVGARVLTLRQACILGAIFETLGAVLIGARVSNTIRKGIISVDSFGNGTEQEFMMGNLAALSGVQFEVQLGCCGSTLYWYEKRQESMGSCIWMLVASFLRVPVSATHSIVGATLGFSIVARGSEGVSWLKLGMIVASWFVSPVLSGVISTSLFFILYKQVLTHKSPLESGLKLLPLFYGLTFAVNLFSIFYKGSELLHFNKIPLYGTFILTFVPAIIGAIIVKLLIVPWQRKKIQKKCLLDIKTKEEQGLIENEKKYEADDSPENSTFLKDLNDGEKTDLQRTSTPAKCQQNGLISNGKLPNGIMDTNVDKLHTDNEKKDKKHLDINFKGIINSRSNISTSSKAPLVNKDSKNVSPNSTASSLDELSDEEKREMARNKIKDTPELARLFSFLQVLTAIFGSFAHGGNDVSNAIGPLVALWITAQTGHTAQEAPVPIWILLIGGLGMSVGLFVWGRRVMKTMGEDLTRITPSSGFCIEVGSAVTVLIASNIGIPISTTHCKVGSIVFVGWYRSREGVDWKLFRNIIIAWFVTLPIAGGISAGIMAIFRAVV